MRYGIVTVVIVSYCVKGKSVKSDKSVTLCQTSFSPLCQVLHEKFTNWYGSIFAALFTCRSVCIILAVWAFRRLDGQKSAGQYLIYWLLTISHTNSKKYNCYMRKQ